MPFTDIELRVGAGVQKENFFGENVQFYLKQVKLEMPIRFPNGATE